MTFGARSGRPVRQLRERQAGKVSVWCCLESRGPSANQRLVSHAKRVVVLTAFD